MSTNNTRVLRALPSADGSPYSLGLIGKWAKYPDTEARHPPPTASREPSPSSLGDSRLAQLLPGSSVSAVVVWYGGGVIGAWVDR